MTESLEQRASVETPDLFRWSTDAVPEPHRLEYYAEMLASAVVPLAVVRRTDAPFEVNLVSGKCGPIDVVRVAGCPHGFVRGTRELKQTNEHSYRLIVNRSTSWDLDHRGANRIEVGDAAFLDSRFGHRTELHPGFETIQLKLSDRWLRQWIADPGLLTGRVFRAGAGGWSDALTAYVRMLTPEFVTAGPLPGGMIADQVGSLLALASQDVCGERPKHAPASLSLSNRILELIRERCTEPDLTAAMVASELQISLRTLHRAMTANQLSFGESLVRCRADVGIRMLESTFYKRLTVAEIARRSGFADASHFSRVVGRQTGRTPRQLRPS
mgnify:CR=1 FL=1